MAIDKKGEIIDLLNDLKEYFDNRADIDSEGGPDEAMRYLTRIDDALFYMGDISSGDVARADVDVDYTPGLNESINRIKSIMKEGTSFKGLKNNQMNEQRVPYNELQNMVKDFLKKEIQFTMDDIQKYVVGNIENIDYHTNGRGFEVGIGNYKSGDGVKDGRGSLSIFPDENKIIFSHNDYKQHPVSGLNEFTNNFFQFISKLDFKKIADSDYTPGLNEAINRIKSIMKEGDPDPTIGTDYITYSEGVLGILEELGELSDGKLITAVKGGKYRDYIKDNFIKGIPYERTANHLRDSWYGV